MLQLGWKQAEAKLIDRKFVKRSLYDRERQLYYEVWDYIVELADTDGGCTRLMIREESFRLTLPSNGHLVPILVNRSRTKAAFDLKDPAISTSADQAAKASSAERDESVQKRKDEARFKRRLGDGGG